MMSCTSLGGRNILSICTAVVFVCGLIVFNVGRVQGASSDPITIWSDVEKNIPPEIKLIANTAKTLVGIYSGVSEFINVATTIARFLEIIPGTQDTARAYMEHQFNFLNEHLDAVAADIEWTITSDTRTQNLAEWDGAINAAIDDNTQGIRIRYRDHENLATFAVLD